jgi:hypothetical protein
MSSWSPELSELENFLRSIKGQILSLEKELQSLLNASEEVTALLFARRSLEVMIVDLCETYLKRPRGTEPLQSILDKLVKENIIPESIHTSMSNLVRISNYGAHPKDFDPRQVRGALIDLSVVVEWYISTKNISIIKPESFKLIHENKDATTNNKEPNSDTKLQQERQKEMEMGMQPKDMMKGKPKFYSNWIFLFLVFSIIVIHLIFGGHSIPKTTINEIKEMIINRDIEKVIVVNKSFVEIYLKKEAVQSGRYPKIEKPSTGLSMSVPKPNFTFNFGVIANFESFIINAQSVAGYNEKEFIDTDNIHRVNYLREIVGWILPFVILIPLGMFFKKSKSARGGLITILSVNFLIIVIIIVILAQRL